MLSIQGSGGSSKGGGSSHTPTEVKNDLVSEAVAKIIEVVSEGEIGGLWNGAQGILLDGTPLMNEDGSYNFKGVYYWERTGLPRQEAIPFDEIEDEVEVSATVKKSDGGVTRQIEVGDFDALRINLFTSSFLMQKKDTGDIVRTKVNLEIWVQPYGGSFTKVTDVQIKGKTNEPYVRSVLTIDWRARFGDGPWNVKIVRLTDDSEGMDIRNEISWASYATIIYAKFEMPDVAAIGLQIDAKQFGDHIPTRSYILTGKVDIEIPSNYDPETRQYTGVWDGTFKLGGTDNPAWIYRDLATNPRYGAGRWIQPANIDKWALYEISKFCDEPVPDGKGGFEPRWTCTLYLQTQEEVFHVLNALSSAFVGMSYWSSGKVTMAQDRPRDVSHQAAPADVIDGQFEYSSVGLAAKCSVIFVTWNNPDLHFKPDIVVVEDPELIRRYGWIKKDYLAVGCIKLSEAIRRGKMLLETEKASPEAVAFRAGFEFADCGPGSIIKLSDPYYAGVRGAGRIAQGATTTKIPLDFPVTLEAGETYTVSITLPDRTVQDRSVTSPAGYKTSLTVSPPLSVVPQAESMWVLGGADFETRLFRCVANRETKPCEFEINGILHDPTKFDRIYGDLALTEPQSGIIPESPMPGVNSISAQVFTFVDGRNFSPGLLLSWRHPKIPGGTKGDPRVTYYVIEYQPNGDGWEELGKTMQPSYEWRGIPPGVYDFRVRGVGLGSGPWGTLEGVTVADPANPIPAVTGLALKTGGTAFNGLDCEVVWNNARGADGFPEARFKDYQVRVLNAAGTITLRTEFVQNESYVYTFEKNLKDNNGAAAASFQIAVSARDILSGAGTAAQSSFSNPLPSMSTITPTITVGPAGFTVGWSTYNPVDTDLDGFDIKVDSVTPPVFVALKADGAARKLFIPVTTAQVPVSYYVAVVPRDKFVGGRAGTASAVVTATVTTSIDNSKQTWADISGTGKPADNATVGATVGTNLKSSSGGTLHDADIVTSQGTAANIANQGDLATVDQANTGNIVLGAVGVVVDRQLLANQSVTVPSGTTNSNLFGWYPFNTDGSPSGIAGLNIAGGNVVFDFELSVVFTGSSFNSAARRGLYLRVDDGAPPAEQVYKDYSSYLTNLATNVWGCVLKDKLVIPCPNGVAWFFFEAYGERATTGTHTIEYQVTGTYANKCQIIIHGAKR